LLKLVSEAEVSIHRLVNNAGIHGVTMTLAQEDTRNNILIIQLQKYRNDEKD